MYRVLLTTSRRVRQLEHRMESLIELITANKGFNGMAEAEEGIDKGKPESAPPQIPTPASTIRGENSVTPTGTSTQSSLCGNGTHHSHECPYAEHETFDPISAGFLDAELAYRLVEDFKTNWVPSFPFVIIESDGPTLRKNRPFLFLAVITIAAVETPPLQHALEAEFRHQLAQSIEHGRKSLDILQGLLIYTGWYHTFFHPATQQLAILVNWCVGLVQELGNSRSQKKKMRPFRPALKAQFVITSEEDLLAGERAMLGAFFCNVW